MVEEWMIWRISDGILDERGTNDWVVNNQVKNDKGL